MTTYYYVCKNCYDGSGSKYEHGGLRFFYIKCSKCKSQIDVLDAYINYLGIPFENIVNDSPVVKLINGIFDADPSSYLMGDAINHDFDAMDETADLLALIRMEEDKEVRNRLSDENFRREVLSIGLGLGTACCEDESCEGALRILTVEETMELLKKRAGT